MDICNARFQPYYGSRRDQVHQNLRYMSPEIDLTDTQERDKLQAVNRNTSQPKGILQLLLPCIHAADALMKNQNGSSRKNTLECFIKQERVLPFLALQIRVITVFDL